MKYKLSVILGILPKQMAKKKGINKFSDLLLVEWSRDPIVKGEDFLYLSSPACPAAQIAFCTRGTKYLLG